MKRYSLLLNSVVLCAAGATLVSSTPALGQVQDRISASEKGSLLVYSKVELRWRQQPGAPGGWQLIQDSFVTINNDYPASTQVQMYFINGDQPLAQTPTERAHPGCNWEDTRITLTQDEPTYWRVSNGQPKGVPPFTALDPGNPPGRPDPEGTGDRLLRGYVVAWAVNNLGVEIRWNHLSGAVTVVNHADATAFEYNAYASQVVATNVGHGSVSGTPGILNLDGVEYAPGFDQLLLDFFAEGSSALSGSSLVTLNTDLTLFPLSVDLRQDHGPRVTTKAKFDIWNQNEIKFSGVERCITCWDQRLLTNYGSIPNHFLIQNLHTQRGRARIDGLASAVCDYDVNPYDGACGAHPLDICSQAASLLGVSVKQLTFDGQLNDASGTNLVGLGTQSAVIHYDAEGGTPPEIVLPTGPQGWVDLIEGELNKANPKPGLSGTGNGNGAVIPPE